MSVSLCCSVFEHLGLQLRAFVYSSDGLWRKELNSSPQTFVESSAQPGLSDAVKRKDAIIRARNAQVAALYEQLHSRGIWHVSESESTIRTQKSCLVESGGF